MAGGGFAGYLTFPVVCSNAGYGAPAPFVGDYAGGNRSLARVCFYRLKRLMSFYLATSRSRAGRPESLTHRLP